MTQLPDEPMTPVGVALGAPSAIGLSYRSRQRLIGSDSLLRTMSASAGITIILMLASLLVVLIYAAMPSVKAFGTSFLTTTNWQPPSDSTDDDTPAIKPSFGALPVIYGTAVSSAVSLLIAVPLSLGAAVFLVRIAPRYLAAPCSFLIEFLAAIPSIAYGLWGLFVLVPFLQTYIEKPLFHSSLAHTKALSWMFHQTIVIGGHARLVPISPNGRDLFCGSVILAIMILPIITAISRDVLKQVPRAQLEGTVALGATWWQSSKEMLKFSRSGLFGAVILGLARAAGETMAVTMVIGNNNQIVPSLFAPAQTMSSLLACEFNEATADIYVAALCEVALILLVMSLLFNVIARYLVVGGGDSRAGAAH